jgi:hypothetical protein
MPRMVSSAGSGSFRFAASGPPSAAGFDVLKVGAGGLLAGMSIADDGTYVVATDTYGAYLWDPNAISPQGNAGGSGAFKQLVTSDRMPADFVASSFLYHAGCYAIAIAPSDSSTIYMAYPVLISGAAFPGSIGVYKTTNKGGSFSKSGFTPIGRSNNDANATLRYWGPRMAVHPTDPLTCYFGTGDSGLWKTTNGGTSWSQLTNLPSATGDPGITGLVIQPGTPATLYAYSFGNGIYKSSDSGANWSRINSGVGPADVMQAALSSNGTLYVIASDATLWTYIGTTWSQRLTAGSGPIRGIAIDPSNAARAIAATYNGLLNETTNNGTAWSGWSNSSTTSATDAPWQQDAFGGPDTIGMRFDRITSNKLLIHGDQNQWTATLAGSVTTATNVTWNSQAVGIEQIVADIIICSRPNSPILGGWDWDSFAIADLSKYPLTHGSAGNVWNGQLSRTWSLDYASTNLDFIVKNADGVSYGGRQSSGYSVDGGRSWTNFSTLPPNTVPNGAQTGAAGNIAAASPTNFIFASANGVQPYCTMDGAASWFAITLPGAPSWSNFIGAYYLKSQMVASDKVGADTFYLLLPGSGVYRSTDKGQNWALRSSAVSGYGAPAKLQATPGSSGVSAGDLWLSSGPGDFTAGAAPNGLALKFTTDGGATWTDTSIIEALGVGFCAPKSGNSYPSVATVGYLKIASATSSQLIGTGTKTFTVATGQDYLAPGVAVMLCDHSNSANRLVLSVVSYNSGTGVLVGTVLTTNGSGTPASWDVYTYGIWRSDDHGTSWTLIGVSPNGNMDYITTLAGDPAKWNKWYFGFNGSGYALYNP